MKELDLILQGWLEQRYPRATPDERALFARFLELPDPEIAGFLFGHAIPADPAMGALVAVMLLAMAGRNSELHGHHGGSWGLLAVAMMLAVPGLCCAADSVPYPEKPIRFIVTFASSSGTSLGTPWLKRLKTCSVAFPSRAKSARFAVSRLSAAAAIISVGTVI
jgi:succinate dehydrogenase flavin-adding protein (antitoxin of CptAB toxin-antitoxin module)